MFRVNREYDYHRMYASIFGESTKSSSLADNMTTPEKVIAKVESKPIEVGFGVKESVIANSKRKREDDEHEIHLDEEENDDEVNGDGFHPSKKFKST